MQTRIPLTPKRQKLLQSLQAQIQQTIAVWLNDLDEMPNGQVSIAPDGTALIIDSPEPQPASLLTPSVSE